MMSARPVTETRETCPEETFRAHCEVAAARYTAGDVDLIEAVDGLQDYAVAFGLDQTIGQDRVQELMAQAFAPVRSKPDDGSATRVPRSTLDAAEWLVFHSGDPKRFETWLLKFSRAERAAITARLKKKRPGT